MHLQERKLCVSCAQSNNIIRAIALQQAQFNWRQTENKGISCL